MLVISMLFFIYISTFISCNSDLERCYVDSCNARHMQSISISCRPSDRVWVKICRT